MQKKRNAASSAGFPLHLIALAALVCALLWLAGGMSLTPAANTSDEIAQVVISEIMASNGAACAPIGGAYFGWVELHNRSDGPVDITGWRISNSSDMRGAYTLPPVILQPDEFLLLYATGGVSVAGEHCLPFELSSTGGALLLSDAQGARADSISFPSLKRSEVYVRSQSGDSWNATGEFTPAMANSRKNHVALINSESGTGGIVISELMSKNRATLADSDGEYSDWIELHNQTGEAVNLRGWALSDDARDRRKWVLPDTQIEPDGYLIVFASGKDRAEGELHANFSLNASGESVYLYGADGALVSKVDAPSIEADISLSMDASGQYTTAIPPSPGQSNSESGAIAALGRSDRTLSSNDIGLYINEVLSSGSGGDWVEIANISQTAIDLSGYGLSDNASRPRKWTFPQGAYIAAGGYLVVGLSDPDDADANKPIGSYQADFALSGGEAILISDASGGLIDKVVLTGQFADASYGRAAGYDRYRYFHAPTPGTTNSATSYEKRANPVEFSVPGGAVSGTIALELTSPDALAIYYTTDGSQPTIDSPIYASPLIINETTVVRAIAWGSDYLPSTSSASSYLYGAAHSVRIVSITGPADQLTGGSGILTTGSKANEVKVNVEMYEADGTRIISQECGAKISGQRSRTQFDQKAIKLIARNEYGDNRFRYPLFDNRDYGEYKSVVLRASGQDNQQTRMRDSILASLCEDTNLMYQETEIVVVYVNGQYWGQFNLRERIGIHSLAQFMGWNDPDNINLLEAGNYNAMNGSNASYRSVLAAVKREGLASDENVEQLRQYVDIENYLDYVAVQIYTSNQDLNNVRLYNNPNQDGLWRWIVYDLDLSYQIDQNSIARWLSDDGVGTVTTQDNTLFKELMKNDKMRDYFLTRMGELLATTFSAENVTSKIQQRYYILQPEMEAHCARWGWSYDTWMKYGQRMLNYAKARPGKLIGYFQSAMNLSDAQMQHYFGEAIAKVNG